VDGDGNLSSKATATDDAPAADPKVYPAFSDFSSVQGQRNWYYQQWNGSTYSNMTWDSANNRWQGSETFILVGDNWQHPDNSYDSVRKWVAPNSGKVRLSGIARKSLLGVGGDGVVVTIKKNGETLWGPKTIAGDDISGISHNFETSVNVGDAIYFIVNKNGNTSYDTTEWSPMVTYTDKWTASEDFSSTQGQNQWYYQQRNGSTYSNMTWYSANNRWQGSETFVLVGDNWQHPDSGYDSVRKWVANKASAQINIAGSVKKSFQGLGGDGVVVTIKKNNTVLWGPVTISAYDTTGVSHNINTSISVGDALFFIVNKNGNNNCDTTLWDPVITY
jgi:hypothetical protein